MPSKQQFKGSKETNAETVKPVCKDAKCDSVKRTDTYNIFQAQHAVHEDQTQ